MPISRRFSPEHPPGEDCLFGLDFSYVIPAGVGIDAASLEVWTNVVPPQPSTDFTVGPVSIEGRVVYARLSGGVDGHDYQLRFTAHDSDGNVWPRTALVLCAQTS